MVVPNILSRRDGNCQTQTQRPRKFLFDLGAYDVAAHKSGSYYIVTIWDDKLKIGSINLSLYYADVASIYSVDARILEAYQGIGIAYRTYEGLVLRANISIISSCQSAGAVKLWRRFAENRYLAIYFVAGGERLFASDIYNVELAHGSLHGVAHGKRFNPYQTEGALLLVRRNSPLERAIWQHMVLHQQQKSMEVQFKRYDHHKLTELAIGQRTAKLRPDPV